MSNSLHPYSYQEREGQYYFTTPSGAKYVAYFLELPLAPHLFTFNFDRIKDGRQTVVDTNVFDTVCSILATFFQNHQDAMLVVCDTVDGREMARMRLFQSWYLRIAPKELLKIDKTGKAENYNLLVSLLVWDDNPHKAELLSLLDEYCTMMLY